MPGNAWAGLKSDIVSGLPYKIILSRSCYSSLAIMAVFRFTSGDPAPSKPGPFCSSTLCHALEKRFEPLIMLSFHAQGKKWNNFEEIDENSHFGKRVYKVYKVQR